MSQKTPGGGETGGKAGQPAPASTSGYGFFEGQRAATRIFKLTNPEVSRIGVNGGEGGKKYSQEYPGHIPSPACA